MAMSCQAVETDLIKEGSEGKGGKEKEKSCVRTGGDREARHSVWFVAIRLALDAKANAMRRRKKGPGKRPSNIYSCSVWNVG